jgi:tetratricopeptide (TPR) repeat protein
MGGAEDRIASGRNGARRAARGGTPARLLARAGWTLAAALALGLPPLGAGAAEPATEPKATMHRVFDAIASLLPASLDEERFSDPARRERILHWLDVLARSTHQLEEHASSQDMGFRYLSRSLSSDVEEIRARYQLGHYDEARFFLFESTKNCVACHSRLPSARDFPLGQRLLDRIDFDSLSAHEKAQILVATRQFDAALDTWEKLFADPETPPAQLDIGGYLLDYLTIAIRVESDLPRARRALEKLAARADVPRYLERHLASWIEELGKLEQSPPTGGSKLDQARTLVERAHRLSDFPAGRERLVYDLLASSLLLQYIDETKKPPSSLAEAFYLLGLVEARSVDAYWVPQTEFHLEAAIRLDPKGPFADDAYALLEEYTVLGYGGSSGIHLPADVWTKLGELRAMIEEPAADQESPGP